MSLNCVYYSLQRTASTGSNQSRKRSVRPCCTTEQDKSEKDEYGQKNTEEEEDWEKKGYEWKSP